MSVQEYRDHLYLVVTLAGSGLMFAPKKVPVSQQLSIKALHGHSRSRCPQKCDREAVLEIVDEKSSMTCLMLVEEFDCCFKAIASNLHEVSKVWSM
ncbi:hypothetical protein KIN20_028997 [Parelaphostrongylus tenuis]|uniref:Uncharacterized protein n=1 Tax=Parelaphostrongylus tenuis TaxID=148309 RepID=A0AAD5R1W1_PARTN|nr:hypothetical protein KIN20_028997 [Parelaphostrongylus tenuis]